MYPPPAHPHRLITVPHQEKVHRCCNLDIARLPSACDLPDRVVDSGGCEDATATYKGPVNLVACLVAIVLPDAMGPSLSVVDTDVLLAAARSEVEASTFAGRHLSALATVIPATSVRPVIGSRAPDGYHPVLLEKVEGGIEIGAFALMAGAAPLGQGGLIDMSLAELHQLGGKCCVGDVNGALGDVWPIGQEVLELLSFKRL